MIKHSKKDFQTQTDHKASWHSLQIGLKDPLCLITLAVYLAVAFIIWNDLPPVSGAGALETLRHNIVTVLYPLCIVGAIPLIVWAFGNPFRTKAAYEGLKRAGLTNSVGEAPLLLNERRDCENPDVTMMEFDSNGVSLSDWEKHRSEFETALNVYTVRIEQGKDKRHVLLYTVPGTNGLPTKINWRNENLNKNNFVLVLGENQLGKVTVDLSKTPHMLIGGSTGSGKSILLKSLLMQCVNKGAKVYIADFKGGVDFPTVWHGKCTFIIEIQPLINFLGEIAVELEDRKHFFNMADCANIDEYNAKTDSNLSHIIFACDEVAELLDKTGRDKDSKVLVAEIEAYLSTIARQGRAFGIHLLLATQRPDANILPGQIKNNMDCRICGRADNVLSQIILDNTDAADQIPKNAQGRFLMNDGTLFQAYWFDERTAFQEGDV